MRIKIRQATTKDVDQIFEIFLDMAKAEDKAMRTSNSYLMRTRLRRDDFESSSKKCIRQKIKTKNTEYLVATIDDKITAYAIGEIKKNKNPFFKTVKTGRLVALAVAKKYRKRGIASLLYQEMEGWFKKRKCLQIDLFVVNNNPAISIYKKWGYKTFVNNMSKKLN